MRAGWAQTALVLLAGCYNVDLPLCAVTCGSDSPCPGDLSCGVDGFCHASGDTQSCLPPTTTLSVGAVGNTGRITSAPSGVNCTTCSGPGCTGVVFAIGTAITLDAHPLGGDQFLNWSGGPCDGQTQTPCVFTLQSATVVNAVFQ
jgi:hypothetical protein